MFQELCAGPEAEAEGLSGAGFVKCVDATPMGFLEMILSKGNLSARV